MQPAKVQNTTHINDLSFSGLVVHIVTNHPLWHDRDFQPCVLKQSNHSDQGGSYILRLHMDICLFLNCHTHHRYSAFSHPSEQAPSASFYPLVLWFSSGQTWRPLPTELPHLSVSSLLAPRKPSI